MGCLLPKEIWNNTKIYIITKDTEKLIEDLKESLKGNDVEDIKEKA